MYKEELNRGFCLVSELQGITEKTVWYKVILGGWVCVNVKAMLGIAYTN
jgi:hypothetical protein